MIEVLSRISSVVATILAERGITAILDVVTKSGASPGSPQYNTLDRSVASSVLADVFYKRFGIGGVAAIFDAGAISETHFSYHYVATVSYREIPMSWDRIEDIEGLEKDNGSDGLFGGSPKAMDKCASPEVVASMYSWLSPYI